MSLNQKQVKKPPFTPISGPSGSGKPQKREKGTSKHCTQPSSTVSANPVGTAAWAAEKKPSRATTGGARVNVTQPTASVRPRKSPGPSWAEEDADLMDTSFNLADFPVLQGSSSPLLPEYQDSVASSDQMDVEATSEVNPEAGKTVSNQGETSTNFWSNYKGIWADSVTLVPGVDRNPAFFTILGNREAKLPKVPSKYPGFPTSGADYKSPEEWSAAIVGFWAVFLKDKAAKVKVANRNRGRKRNRTAQSSSGDQNKRVDQKATPVPKSGASGATAKVTKRVSYAKAAARNVSVPSPFAIILHGPAGGSDSLPKETFNKLALFIAEKWVEQNPSASSRGSKWANGTGYIHPTDQSSQDWYMDTLNSAPEKQFTAYRKQEYDMTMVRVKVPEAISSMKPEVLLQAAFKGAGVQGRFAVKSVHQIKEGGKVIRLLLEDSLVTAIDRLGNALTLGCDVLQFEKQPDKKASQPQQGKGEAGGQTSGLQR